MLPASCLRTCPILRGQAGGRVNCLVEAWSKHRVMALIKIQAATSNAGTRFWWPGGGSSCLVHKNREIAVIRA